MTKLDMKGVYDRFATNDIRKVIYEGYKSYNKELLKMLDGFVQFIDGSYTTDKDDPTDIDVVTFLDILFIQNNKNILMKLYKENGIMSYKVDGNFCPVCDENSPYFSQCKERKRYWTKWLSQDKKGNPKELFVCNIKKGQSC